MSKALLLSQGYLPPVLKHNSYGWHIEYYQFNPILGKLTRERVRLNTLRKKASCLAEFKIMANNYLNLIAQQLMNGALMTNQAPVPMAKVEGLPDFPISMGTETQEAIKNYQPLTSNVRYYQPIVEVYDKYIEEKGRDLREETMRSYKSCRNMFTAWIEKRYPGCQCIMFTKQMAIEYLDESINEKGWRNNTYNNNLKQLRVFFAWMIEKCYIKENHFETIKTRKKEKKLRTLATTDYRKLMRDYFLKNCPEYLIVAELVFNALIRPIEISRIKVGQVRLAEKVIRLNEDQTKNGYKRDCVLSDELIKILSETLSAGYPNDYYLIGPGYKPGEKAISTKMYRKTWNKMREETGIPETVKLYSLRDTGLTEMFQNGADANTVKRAADHHDLAMTTIYCDHVDEHLVENVRKYTPKF